MTTKKSTYHHGSLRMALLDEAARMISENGAESVTLRELGRRLGVSRTAPYRHFANKEAMLVAVAAEGFRRLRERLHALEVPNPDDDLARFQQMGVVYIQFAIENPAHYRLMYGREALRRAHYPELESAADAAFYELVGIIESYQQAGKIKTADARALAYVTWSAVHGLASLLVDQQIKEYGNLETLARLTTKTLLEGIRA